MSAFNQHVRFKGQGVRGKLLKRQARLNCRNRSAAWIILTLAVLALLPQTSFAMEVQGRELSWSMPAPDGWVGGSFYQIETSIQNTGNENLRSILRMAQAGARDVEAVLIHLEDAFSAAHRDPSFSTRTLTEIVVQYVPFEARWDELTRQFGSALLEDYPQGTVRLTSEISFQAGQLTAHEAVFEIRLAGAGVLYRTLIALPVSSGRWLLFRLKVDSSRHEARLATLRRTVGSVRID